MKVNVIHFLDANCYLVKSTWSNLYVDGKHLPYGQEATRSEVPEMFLRMDSRQLESLTLADGTIVSNEVFNATADKLKNEGMDDDDNWFDIDLEYQYKKLVASIVSRNYNDSTRDEPVEVVIHRGFLEFKDASYVQPIIDIGTDKPYLLRVNIQSMDWQMAKSICEDRGIILTIPNTGLKYAKIADKYVFYGMSGGSTQYFCKYEDFQALKDKRKAEITSYINAVVTPMNELLPKTVSEVVEAMRQVRSNTTKQGKDRAADTAIKLLMESLK